MALTPYLYSFVILFGGALVVIAISQRFKIPAVVGFLITGMVVGPHGLCLIRDAQHVEIFAELGIVFLLFIIGLEVSLVRLKNLGKILFIGGAIQMGGTILLTAVLSHIIGYGVRQSLFFGFLVSLSSTAIVLNLYSDRKELSAPQGKISMGILLFQDFLIVPLLLAVPMLAGVGQGTSSVVFIRFLGGLGMLAFVFVVGRYLVPRFMHIVVQTKIRELFVIGALFLCLGSALITEKLGFSLALGGFLAGILVADSDYYHQVVAETTPFRDVFNSIFFISIGMLLHLDFLFRNTALVFAVALCIVLIKISMLWLSVTVLSFPWRICLLTSIGMCQIGEFSFVLLRAGKLHGLLDPWYYNLAIASSVITMLLAPLLIGLAPVLTNAICRRKIPDKKTTDALKTGKIKQKYLNRVVIFGYGLAGQHLAGVLKTASIPYLIVDIDGRVVKRAKAKSEPILFGDATRISILKKCGLDGAKTAVFLLSDPTALKQSVRLARQMNPSLFITVRVRQQLEIEEIRQCGANEVVSEEFETSIELFTNVLTRLHIPGNIIRDQTRLLRADGYQMLRSRSLIPGVSDKVIEILTLGTTDTFYIAKNHYAADKSILETDLRKNSGATIIAVVRDEKSVTNPAANFILKAGDVLVLVGNHAEIDNAFAYLEKTMEEKI